MYDRTNLLKSLKGQTVVLPDLFNAFAAWPRLEANVNYRKLAAVSDQKLESVFKDKRKLAALKGSDFPLFAATWWPKAPYEETCVMLFMTIWLFTWDDEIDEPTGSYSEDLESANGYREQTIDFVLHCLGFGPASGLVVEPTNRIVGSFQDIGEPLANAYTLDQRKRFLEEMTRFLEHSKQEQRIRLSGRIPNADEYWHFRMGTSAVGIAVAALEYALKIRISNAAMRDPRMEVIADETIIIISIVNDLLSLKKEIKKDCIDSIVPIYCSAGMSVQDAVDEAVQALRESVERFDVAAAGLRTSAREEPLKYEHVGEWVEGCQNYCMGNLIWSLATGRYGVTKYLKGSDGSIEFTL